MHPIDILHFHREEDPIDDRNINAKDGPNLGLLTPCLPACHQQHYHLEQHCEVKREAYDIECGKRISSELEPDPPNACPHLKEEQNEQWKDNKKETLLHFSFCFLIKV